MERSSRRGAMRVETLPVPPVRRMAMVVVVVVVGG